MQIKLKIKVTEGIVEVVNTAASDHRPSHKSTISPKPVKAPSPQFPKPKRTQVRDIPRTPQNLNIHIPQDVALANEAVHCGIADSVKTKKRRCKDNKKGYYSPERSYSPEMPMLMLSPKKRKSRKKTENNVPFKKSKSDVSFNQSSYVLDKRKNFDTFRELFAQPEDNLCFSSPTKLYNEQGSNLSLGSSKILNNQPVKKNPDTLKELYNQIEPTSSMLPNPSTLAPEIEIIDLTPCISEVEIVDSSPSNLFTEQKSVKSLGNNHEPVSKFSSVPKKDLVDIPLPFDIIADIERWFKCNNKDYMVDKVESTVMDPTFEKAKKKFHESAASFVREYLSGGFPDLSEIDRAYFDKVIREYTLNTFVFFPKPYFQHDKISLLDITVFLLN